MDTKTEITPKKKMVKLYGTKQEIAYIFGVNLKTLANDLTAMRRLPEFAGYVLNVGHKRVNISVKGYGE
ncbi:DNA-binding protein [Lactococcus sp. NH2-7C]|uniref:DNA-binding protein n=1 Tax=Lactococcus sp. NH2-7C TaxID=2879149 RepID=UPI00286845F3|nr:DNA-binding protein [Lactococcus sp. NH2-7C]